MWKLIVLYFLLVFWWKVRGEVQDELKSIMDECCAVGSEFGSTHTEEDCAASQPMPSEVPANFRSVYLMCIMARAVCCTGHSHKKSPGYNSTEPEHVIDTTTSTSTTSNGTQPEKPFSNTTPSNTPAVNVTHAVAKENQNISRCPVGYRLNEEQECVDIDECRVLSGDICQQQCVNTMGSYTCQCFEGYILNDDERTCSDIDECKSWKTNFCMYKCHNEIGGYRCSCPHGYALSNDTKNCLDINECKNGEAPCDFCYNTRGSYVCPIINCPPGYFKSDQKRCTKNRLVCSPGDSMCAHQPSSISYNFITFPSKLNVPVSDLFTMHGPNYRPYGKFILEWRLINVSAPPDVKHTADIDSFLAIQTDNKAVMSLVRSLEGPQSIELELSMELYIGEQLAGAALAKLFIYVSEYEF